jgi:hypothetical protein
MGSIRRDTSFTCRRDLAPPVGEAVKALKYDPGSLVDHFGHAVVFMLRASVHRSLVAVRVDPFCVVNHSGAVGTDVKVC